MWRVLGGALLLLAGSSVPFARSCSFQMLTELDSILPLCCGSTTADDCSDGFPPRCSPQCAELLVPYWEECSSFITFMGDDALSFAVEQMNGFIEPCNQALSLQEAASRSVCGDSSGSGSWIEDVNSDCCTQHGINVCRQSDSDVPWLCDSACALTYLPYVEECLDHNALSPDFAQLQETCTAMNTRNPEEVVALIMNANEIMDNPHCHINTSSIVSVNSSGTGDNMANPVCIDDDLFIQSAFSNPGATCALMAGAGLCGTLMDSNMEDRCCLSCIQGSHGRRAVQSFAEDTRLFPAAFQNVTRVVACPITSFFDRSYEVSAKCCSTSDCSANGPPQECSFECAHVFVPFLNDCGVVMRHFMSETDYDDYVAFDSLCTNMDVTSLVLAIHHSQCWYCGDGVLNEDEECDAGGENPCTVSENSDEAVCANGGTCHQRNTAYGYECQCTENYIGDTCETAIDAVYLCHVESGEDDCSDNAICRHTGPGTHECTCLLGYSGDGLVCDEAPEPHCQDDCSLEVLCQPLSPPDGGTIAYSNGLSPPTRATYSCDNELAPENGDITRECQSDGAWAGTAPTCPPLDMPCRDTDGGTSGDTSGNMCTAYGNEQTGDQHYWCGYYDGNGYDGYGSYFDSYNMCCACGGGSSDPSVGHFG